MPVKVIWTRLTNMATSAEMHKHLERRAKISTTTICLKIMRKMRYVPLSVTATRTSKVFESYMKIFCLIIWIVENWLCDNDTITGQHSSITVWELGLFWRIRKYEGDRESFTSPAKKIYRQEKLAVPAINFLPLQIIMPPFLSCFRGNKIVPTHLFRLKPAMMTCGHLLFNTSRLSTYMFVMMFITHGYFLFWCRLPLAMFLPSWCSYWFSAP